MVGGGPGSRGRVNTTRGPPESFPCFQVAFRQWIRLALALDVAKAEATAKAPLRSALWRRPAEAARPLGFPHIEGDIIIHVGGASVIATARRCLS